MKSQLQKIIIWGFAVVIVLGFVFSLFDHFTKKPNTTQNTSVLFEITPADNTKGSPNASVTLIEYGDFQCPSCLAYYPFVTQLMREFPTMVRVVFRDFPMTTIHPNAQAAAQAAEAAAKQGKFWEMHNALFDNQSIWANERDPENLFISYAKQIGLDANRFLQDMNSVLVSEKIKKDQESGTSLNVQGTPTFFLNGKEIENPKDYSSFKLLIEEEILK